MQVGREQQSITLNSAQHRREEGNDSWGSPFLHTFFVTSVICQREKSHALIQMPTFHPTRVAPDSHTCLLDTVSLSMLLMGQN